LPVAEIDLVGHQELDDVAAEDRTV
jgi:hypothetical protein